ncbi:MAG: rod-binding protein [Planctomycetota bacterium]
MDVLQQLQTGMDSQTAASMRDLAEAKHIAETARGDLSGAAQKFEALLATTLVREMRQTLDEGFFGSGPGSDSYSGILDEKIAEQLVRRPIFGIEKMLEAAQRGRATQPAEPAEVAPAAGRDARTARVEPGDAAFVGPLEVPASDGEATP